MANANIKIGASSSAADKELRNLGKQLKNMQSQFNLASTKAKLFGKESDRLKVSQQELTNKMKLQNNMIQIQKEYMHKLSYDINKANLEQNKLQKEIDDTTKAYKESVKATGKNSEESKELSNNLKELKESYAANENVIENANRKLENARSKLNNTEKSLLENKKALEEVNKSLSNVKIDTFIKKFDVAGEKLKTIGGKVSGIGNSFSWKITAPVMALGSASIKMASDVNESLNKVEVVFGDSADEIKAFTDTTLESFGISKNTALEMTSLYGDMGKSMGLSKDKVDEYSISLVGAAGDLASFKNISVERAQYALSGIYTGETEALKSMGIVMTEVNLQEYANSIGIKKKLSQMTQAEKVSLRYQYVMDKAKDAVGDFAKTSASAGNQMRSFPEATKELSATIGQDLLPTFTPFITTINDIIKKFGQLDEGTRQNIIKFVLFAASIGPVLKIVGGLTSGIGILCTGVSKSSKLFKKMRESTLLASASTKIMAGSQALLNFVMSLNPIVFVIGLLVALGATFVILYNKCDWFREGIQQIWSTITDIFKKFDDFLTNIFSVDWSESFGSFGDILNGFLANVRNIWEGIKSIFRGIVDFVAGVFTGDWTRAWEGVKNIFGGIFSTLGGLIKTPLNAVIGLINGAITQLNKISIDIPDWIPIFGGSHFGVNIPKINYLYEGGIVTKPTFINGNTVAGDSFKGTGNQAEAIIPLASMYNNLRKIIREEQKQNTVVYITTQTILDGEKIAEKTTKKVIKQVSKIQRDRGVVKGGQIIYA